MPLTKSKNKSPIPSATYYKKKYLNSTPTSDIKEEGEEVELCTASQKAADELKPKERMVETIIGRIVAVEAKIIYILSDISVSCTETIFKHLKIC